MNAENIISLHRQKTTVDDKKKIVHARKHVFSDSHKKSRYIY